MKFYRGLPTTRRHKTVKRDSPDCSSTAFYTAPASGANITSGQPLTISWDTSYATCFSSAAQIDISLTSADTTSGHIKVFSGVSFALGTYTQTLQSAWWNNTGDISMQIAITPSGTLSLYSSVPAGPIVDVTYDASASSSDTNDPGLNTTKGAAQAGGLPRGSVAAAVLLPILLILAAVGVYVKISRKKRAEKTRRFSQAIDARMSRISGDWQSLSARGAQVALRDSIATGAGMRMSTVFASEMAVRPSMERASTMERASAAWTHQSGETRQSRISFAADTNASKDRLSMHSTGRASRAFHVGTTAPPVPEIPSTAVELAYNGTEDIAYGSDYNEKERSYYEDEHELAHSNSEPFSPTQTQGPLEISSEDVDNVDISPALHMMRTSNDPALQSVDNLLLTPPAPPTPTYVAPPSPLGTSFAAPPLSPLGAMPMQPQQFMSPDDLLKQYAEARKTGAKSPSYSAMSVPVTVNNISIPSAVYAPSTGSGSGSASPTVASTGYTATGMRNLTGDPTLSRSNSDY